jgi:hypothetical protein
MIRICHSTPRNKRFLNCLFVCDSAFHQHLVTPATKQIKCHAGPDPASSLLLVPGFRRDDVWIPAFAGMTTLIYIVAGVITLLAACQQIRLGCELRMQNKRK